MGKTNEQGGRQQQWPIWNQSRRGWDPSEELPRVAPQPEHVAARTKGSMFLCPGGHPRALALLGSSPPRPRPRPLPSSPSPIELYGRNLCHSSLSPAASQPPTPLATGWVSQDC